MSSKENTALTCSKFSVHKEVKQILLPSLPNHTELCTDIFSLLSRKLAPLSVLGMDCSPSRGLASSSLSWHRKARKSEGRLKGSDFSASALHGCSHTAAFVGSFCCQTFFFSHP